MKFMNDFRRSLSGMYFICYNFRKSSIVYIKKWHASEQAFSNLSLLRGFWQDSNASQRISDARTTPSRGLF
jgi:hypothetical protein